MFKGLGSGRLSNGSSAAHNFARSPQATIPRSSFDRSHGCKTTFDAGYLVPVFVDEALPGDTFKCKMTAFARLATPIFPIMDNMYLETFFFAVPYRLVWENWERFNGAQDDPGDSTSFVIPQMTVPGGGYASGSLADYFGLPIGVAGTFTHSSLWFRAYNLIYNTWFRSEDLQNSVVVDLDDGPDAAGDYVLLRRGKRHDYFTSCLPFPQKGPAVDIPLGTSADITYQVGPAAGILARRASDGALMPNPVSGSVYLGTDASTGVPGEQFALVDSSTYPGPTAGVGRVPMIMDPNGTLIADLSTATAATINSLRLAFQTQKLFERDARGGTRYTEILKSHFGVTSPDARLQRPEYLGGGSAPVIVSPIPQTSVTAATPQGNLAAIGTCSVHGHGFVKSFTEHCLLIGLVSVRADLNYQEGLNRMWSRSTRFDFYWPALSHIGEQAVLNQEIYTQGTSADQDVFGYQERYAEYRYKPSIVTGLLRSDAAGTLDSWHLAQDFTALPVLNATFIVENPPMTRIKAVTSQPDFIFDSVFNMHCVRPMPVYSVPGLIDHF